MRTNPAGSQCTLWCCPRWTSLGRMQCIGSCPHPQRPFHYRTAGIRRTRRAERSAPACNPCTTKHPWRRQIGQGYMPCTPQRQHYWQHGPRHSLCIPPRQSCRRTCRQRTPCMGCSDQLQARCRRQNGSRSVLERTDRTNYDLQSVLQGQHRTIRMSFGPMKVRSDHGSTFCTPTHRLHWQNDRSCTHYTRLRQWRRTHGLQSKIRIVWSHYAEQIGRWRTDHKWPGPDLARSARQRNRRTQSAPQLGRLYLARRTSTPLCPQCVKTSRGRT